MEGIKCGVVLEWRSLHVDHLAVTGHSLILVSMLQLVCCGVALLPSAAQTKKTQQ